MTSSGRPPELFRPLLREGRKKRPFHYWDCHSQFGLTVSMHKVSRLHPYPTCSHPSPSHSPLSKHTPYSQTPAQPLLPVQRVAVVTVWLDHQSWPLTAVFLSTWTGRSQLALSYRCPSDPAPCVFVCGSADTEVHTLSNCTCVLFKQCSLLIWALAYGIVVCVDPPSCGKHEGVCAYVFRYSFLQRAPGGQRIVWILSFFIFCSLLQIYFSRAL